MKKDLLFIKKLKPKELWQFVVVSKDFYLSQPLPIFRLYLKNKLKVGKNSEKSFIQV